LQLEKTIQSLLFLNFICQETPNAKFYIFEIFALNFTSGSCIVFLERMNSKTIKTSKHILSRDII